MKHYQFGSSTAARTDACPAWVKESEGVPRKESSFAIDGTITHGILECFALDEACPDIVEGHRVEEEHRTMAYEMWDAAQKVLADHDMVEWEPEVTAVSAGDTGGTLDLVAAARTTKAMLLDYKTGRGVQVSAVNNKQLLFAAANMLYGESSCRDLVEDKETFIGVILQPDSAGEVQTKTWEFTREQVDHFWEHHQVNIAKAREGGGDLCAGDHCKFCPANGLCDATTGRLLDIQRLDPQDQEQLLEGLDMIAAVQDTIRALEKLAFEQLEVGVELPGWKLVAKRATEKWVDEEAAIRKFRRVMGGKKEIVQEKLVSPAQMRKLAKAKGLQLDLDNFTERKSFGTTLAPESDKREAVLSSSAFKAALDAVK